jgi:hypothetical protein
MVAQAFQPAPTQAEARGYENFLVLKFNLGTRESSLGFTTARSLWWSNRFLRYFYKMTECFIH